jgi:hypothetical protein
MGDSGGSVLEGQVTRVVFQDEETLFASVKVAPEGGGPEVSVIGEFLAVSAGDEFTFTGDWETHPKWGPQLRIRNAQRDCRGSRRRSWPTSAAASSRAWARASLGAWSGISASRPSI